ncbi:hypothetical protein HRbin37_00785 [bacterium HR37]|nr:hypothetical protein HRbin37_00785 [bacterium HR37]
MTAQKELYALEAITYIPRILALVDRNPLSPTFGCFDKSYWHYKTVDFPSGMYQECVLPLALVYSFRFPGGDVYYGNERVRELVIAGIRYADRSSHRDGSTDDYYPFERALGATCFSLYACTESYMLLGLSDGDIVRFFKKRGSWLLKHNESGRLSNHQALCALCLYNVFLVTGEEEFLEGAKKRIELVLSWQSDEGWFQEYEGADPGYQTFTIDFLAKYYKKSGDERVVEPLKKAVDFASYFIHPDGSYGGEYGSRNTFNFYPHGFEILGKVYPLATQIADRFLLGVKNRKRAYIEDERIFFHFVSNFLQAYLDFNECRTGSLDERGDFEKYFEKAGIYVRKENKRYCVLSLAKGGVIKVFSDGKHIYSDNGLIAKLSNGRLAVTHHVDRYEVSIGKEKVEVSGSFGLVKLRLPTPFKFLLFRLGLLTFGRFSSNLVRRLLQRLLIVGKKSIPIWFRRTFLFEDGLKIVDEIRYISQNKKYRIERLFAGVDHTSIYVVMSNCYQESVLAKWIDYSSSLDELNRSGYLKIERRI